MKRNLFLLVIAVFALYSCDDLGTVDIDTTLSKTLNASVEELTSLKSTTAGEYPFYEAGSINLSENDDLKDYLNDIKELDIYNVSCKLNGIPSGETIVELTVFSNTANLSVTLNGLTENNNTYELNLSGAELKALGEHLMQYKELDVGVSGLSSYAPMILNVTLNFKTKVKAKVI